VSATTASTASRVAQAKNRTSTQRLLAIFVATAAVVVAAIATANFWLDPMNYSTTYHRRAAAAFESGKNFAIYDPTIDYRGLRREHIRMMAKAPDIILFSGSRFELVGSDVFPKGTFYNAFVQRDYFDDMLAMVELLHSNNKLPKNLVMSSRYVTFRPHPSRPEGDGWKMFVPEAAAMARRLNVEPPSRWQHFPWAHWSTLLSVPRLMHQIQLRLKTDGDGIGATTAKSLPTMDVLLANGAISFSQQHSKSFTVEAARKGSAKKAEEDRGKKVTPPDPKLLAQYKAMLEFLVGKGVNVAIVHTPQHPAYWNGVKGSAYGDMLIAMEEEVRRITVAAGAQFVGSFDPAKADPSKKICTEAAFRDFIHVSNKCLKSVFDRIKLKI
jgi:hypothetical protein